MKEEDTNLPTNYIFHTYIIRMDWYITNNYSIDDDVSVTRLYSKISN